MRYNDIRNGTNVVDEILPKYKAAWADEDSMFASNDLIVDWYRVRQKDMAQPMSIGFTAWFVHLPSYFNGPRSNPST